MGICLWGTEISYTPFTITDTYTSREAGAQFLHGFPEYMQEVAVGLLPVVVFFALFQIFSLHLKKDASSACWWASPTLMWGWCCSSPA